MTFVLVLISLVLGAAAILSIVRVIKGPSILDRMLAADVLIVITICALLTEMSFNKHTFTMPVVLVLAMFGFIGSVIISRFVVSRR